MGSGSWSSTTYASVTGARVASGSTFGYYTAAAASGKHEAHEALDPKRLNSAGKNIRESRDSDEHPVTHPMVIAFDQTGSMGSIPGDMQQKLKTVFNLTLEKGIKGVQVAIAAYGDAANGEFVPLQVSQFESDNRIDDALDNLYLEGDGGGNGGETSNLLFYYLAHHVEMDSLEKRGEKGKLYVIADEKQVPINADIVQKYIGEQPIGGLSFESIANDLTKKFDVTILLIDNASARWQRSQEFYTKLFGPDSLTVVQDVSAIPEMIAGLFAYDMGQDIDDIVDGLAASSGKEVAVRVGTTLKKRGTASVGLR